MTVRSAGVTNRLGLPPSRIRRRLIAPPLCRQVPATASPMPIPNGPTAPVPVFGDVVPAAWTAPVPLPAPKPAP